jgi:predicted ATPase
MGDSPQRFSVMAGLWRLHLSRARLEMARELAEQCFTLAQHLQDPILLQEAHQKLGATLFYLGELASAHTHLEQGIALYDPHQGHAQFLSGGADPGVACLSWAAWTLWLLGYPDRSLRRMDEALTLARALSDAYSLGFALYFASTLYIWRREVQPVQETLAAMMAISQEQGFVRWLGGGMIKQGWILAQQGAVQEAMAQMHQGLSIWRTAAGEMGLPGNLSRLADAYGKAGRAEEGLHILAEALAAIDNHAELYSAAEVYRIQGELLLLQATPDASQAETSFQRALDVARHQQAKALELRATMSLARLWQHQGKRHQAHQMLAESYGWFTEGFDTPDLQEAKALLAALA